MAKKDKKKSVEQAPIEDSRFQELKTDPRYLEMPKKNKKVVIDDRFKKMFDKKSEFNTIGKRDKTGKKIKVEDRTMEKYYKLEEEEESGSADDEKPEKKDGSKFYDEEGNFHWNQESSSSSSEEAEEEAELEQEEEDVMWDAENDIPYEEMVGEEGVGKRVALNKMDWDSLSAIDILALFKT